MMKIRTKYYLAFANVSIQTLFIGIAIWMMLNGKGDEIGNVGWLLLYQFVTAIIGAALQNKWRIDSIAAWFTMLMVSGLVVAIGALISDGSETMEYFFANIFGVLFTVIAPLVYFIYSIRELAYFHKHPDRIQEGNRELFEDILDADDI